MAEEPDLLSLAKRTLRGEGAAEEQLAVVVLAIAAGVVRRRAPTAVAEIAEDVAQDTWIAVREGLADLRTANSRQVGAWIASIARSRLGDRWRRQKRATRMQQYLAFMATPDREGPDSKVERDQDVEHGDDMTGRAIVLRLVWQAYSQLSETRQELLDLRFAQGKTWSEVGVSMGISRSAAKRRYQRLQAAMRRDLDGRLEQLSAREQKHVGEFLRD